MSEESIFALAARKAMSDPMFLGHDLYEYCVTNGLGLEALSRELNCSVATIDKLSLCLRPIPESSTFRKDVERISTHCGVDGQKLVEMLREVDSVRSMRNAPIPKDSSQSDRNALLMAARDRRIRRTDPKRKLERKKRQ